MGIMVNPLDGYKFEAVESANPGRSDPIVLVLGRKGDQGIKVPGVSVLKQQAWSQSGRHFHIFDTHVEEISPGDFGRYVSFGETKNGLSDWGASRPLVLPNYDVIQPIACEQSRRNYEEYCLLRIECGFDESPGMTSAVWCNCSLESQADMLEQMRVGAAAHGKYVKTHGEVW